MMNWKTMVYYGIPLGCIFFLVSGCAFFVWRAMFVSNSKIAQATLVRLIESYDEDGELFYKHEFSFVDDKGGNHSAVSMIASYPPHGKVGDIIEILYDPENPSRVDVNTFSDLWGIPTVFCSFGIIGLIIWQVVCKRIFKEKSLG